MGAQGAQAFAELVNDGSVQLEAAVSWHLTANHYPAHPAFMIPVAVAAIKAGRDEEWDTEIVLPRVVPGIKGFVYTTEHDDVEDIIFVVEWRGETTVPAGEVIESFHLDSFL